MSLVKEQPAPVETHAMAAPDVSVIVPTYREAENLLVLVPRLAAALAAHGVRAEIVVVDDNSPDDTVAVCRQLAEEFPVRLEVRLHERGLSTAVTHGLRLARGATLVVMDADLSHPPEKVPELLAALDDADTDFVIGSRYVDGGTTDERWGWFRWWNSRIATWLARPFTSARDPMAGFFALRRSTFRAAAPLDPIGYKIGLELIVKCGCRSIREVPIEFADRLHGTSKLNWKEQVNYLRHVGKLAAYKLRKQARPVLFVLVGLTGMAVDLGSLLLLLPWLAFPAARALSIWLAMTWNFLGNRWLTFPEARRRGVLAQYALFCGGCLLGGAVNWLISVGLSRGLPFFANLPALAAALGAVGGAAFNYLLSRHVTFRE